jgi:hypothetical protein
MDCKYAVVQSSGAHNFYWVSIVHTILLSFILPPGALGHKKQKKKKNEQKKTKKSKKQKQTIPVVKYSAVYAESR